jgi:site-specific DNA recombinase
VSKTDSAILLCRVSSAGQTDGYSLEAQERIGQEYCKAKGFGIINRFILVETGSKSHDRKKFDIMMQFIGDHIVTSVRPLHLIVEKPDRLTRNFTNREQLQFFVMSGKLVIHFYKDRRIMDKTCSPADIFTDDIMTSVSKYIALNIARETKKGMNEKARNGWFPGHAPFGYKNVRTGNENKHGKREAKIVIDAEEKPAVLRAYELRALHSYSYYAIRTQILEENLLPKTRHKGFSKSSVERILTNKFYEGRYFWDGEWHQGKHETFVPIEWIRKVDGRRGTPNTAGTVGPFSYLVTCVTPGCGCQVIYDPKTKTNKTTGEARIYHYYHCSDGKRFHKLNKLRQVNISESQLWESLSKAIIDLQLTPELAQVIAGHIQESGQSAKETAQEQRAQAQSRLSQMVQKEDELYDHWSTGLLSKDTYTRHLERLKAEREELDRKLIVLENANEASLDAKTETLLELCKRVESDWKSYGSEDRIRLAKKFCSNFRLDGANLCFDLRTPFKILLELKRNSDFQSWYPGQDLNLHTLRH